MARPRRFRRESEAAGFAFGASQMLIELSPAASLRYPVPSDLYVESVGDEDWLVWPAEELWTLGPLEEVQCPIPQRCLSQFVRLADAPSTEIETFAHTWGPLGRPVRKVNPWDYGSGTLIGGDRERVSLWRSRAGELHAIMTYAADLALGEDPREAYMLINADQRETFWMTKNLALRLAEMRGEHDHATETVRDGRLLAYAVARWIEYGRVQLTPQWLPSAGRLLLEVRADALPGLAGILALELAAALSSPLGIARCHGCGFPYVPWKRRPRRDRANYCAECSQGASLAAKRAWYHRKRARAAVRE